MAEVIFFEKPGCINNTKQKQLLADAGHTVIARNLLTYPWTLAELKEYFSALPVHEWFNRSAPSITSGTVDPDALNEETAYQLLLKEPLLIRRPLMQIGAQRLVGFEPEKVNAVVELMGNIPAGLEQCPRKAEHTTCD